MQGYIKLHRKFKDWQWYTEPNMVLFFIHCILRASHKETEWKGIKLNPGQFISGRKALALETGMSEQQVRTCINKLKSGREITTKSTNKNTIFTIKSWKKYQVEKEANQQPNQQATNKQPASNHYQECKEGKECKRIYMSFDHLSITCGEVRAIEESLNTNIASINETLLAIQNYAKNNKYKSLYLTTLKWMKKNSSNGSENPNRPNIKPRIKVGELKDEIHSPI